MSNAISKNTKGKKLETTNFHITIYILQSLVLPNLFLVNFTKPKLILLLVPSMPDFAKQDFEGFLYQIKPKKH